MKKTGNLFVMLSLIAMAPSYAAKRHKTHEVKKQCTPKKAGISLDSSFFKGVENRIVFVDNGNCGTGDGTFFNPYTSIATAAVSSRPGTLIYVIATGMPYESGTQLQPSQILVSSSCAIKIGDCHIPAATPGQKAEIVVADGESGVSVSNCNQICGFTFSANLYDNVGSIGIDSLLSGAGGNTFISKNSFENLSTSIDVTVQDWSELEICDNCFLSSENTTSSGTVDLSVGEGAVIKIGKNSFDGILPISHVFCEPSTLAKKEEVRSKALSKDIKTVQALAQSSHSSSEKRVYLIEENTFRGSANEAIAILLDGDEVKFIKNDISGTFGTGVLFSTVSLSPPIIQFDDNRIEAQGQAALLIFSGTATVSIERNSFKSGSEGLYINTGNDFVSIFAKKNSFEALYGAFFVLPKTNLSLEQNLFNSSGPGAGCFLTLVNGNLTFEKNLCKNGGTGLELIAQEDVTACVEKNCFEDQNSEGFHMTVTGGSACLQLVRNKAESSGTGYLLTNDAVYSGNFEVAEKHNSGTIVVDASPITPVTECSGCCR